MSADEAVGVQCPPQRCWGSQLSRGRGGEPLRLPLPFALGWALAPARLWLQIPWTGNALHHEPGSRGALARSLTGAKLNWISRGAAVLLLCSAPRTRVLGKGWGWTGQNPQVLRRQFQCNPSLHGVWGLLSDLRRDGEGEEG